MSKLSKSRVLTGLQCKKALHLLINSPDLAAATSSGQQRIFDQGHEVGELAQKRFAPGILIDVPYTDPKLALEKTKAAIESKVLNIYEATIESKGVLVKVDILHRDSVGKPWTIFEVKSSTSVKEVHILDAAIQLWVCKKAGLKIAGARVVHINNQCEFPQLENLFTVVDVTDDAEAALKKV